MTRPFEFYFRPKAAELDGRLYQWLGVVCFKRLLLRLVKVDPNKPHANSYVLEGRGLEHLVAFEGRTRRSEMIHMLGLAFSALFLILALRIPAMCIPGIVLFLANFHCFILQRYNRIRIYRLFARARTTLARPR